MRILLITGGAGFIGSNFVRYWAEHHPDDRLVVLDALTYAGNLENLDSLKESPNYSFIKGDIRDFPLLEKLFAKEDIDTVFHFAAESHVDRSILGPQDFIDTNIQGTFSLLEAARNYWGSGQKGKRFIHVSTDEVYGSLEFNAPAFTEKSQYKPNNPYAASKASSDHLVYSYNRTYKMPAIVTHCSNNYGPYQFPEKLIPLMIINALEGKPLPVYAEGKSIRDWTHVDDHCRALDRVLECGTDGEVYNIGGNCEKQTLDVVHKICDLVDEKQGNPVSSRDLITFVDDRPGHDMRYAIDTSKISRELGWNPQESYDTGFQRTVDWYIENQNWWQRVRSGAYQDYYEEQYGKRLTDAGAS